MRLDPDGEIAQDVFVETLQPFDLVDRRRRRVEVHQREMRLAVLAQPVGEGLHAPIFGLLDRSAEAFDDALQLRGQFLDLLRAGVLARKIDVFIERHGCPFLICLARPGAKPLEPFGKGSNALKAGTPDAGPDRVGPTATTLTVELRAAVRSAPGRGRAEGGLIRGGAEKARRAWRSTDRSEARVRPVRILDQLGEPHREFDAFAQLLGVGGRWLGAFGAAFSSRPAAFRGFVRAVFAGTPDRSARASRSASVTGEKVLINSRSRMTCSARATTPWLPQCIHPRLSLSYRTGVP